MQITHSVNFKKVKAAGTCLHSPINATFFWITILIPNIISERYKTSTFVAIF